MCIGFSFGMSLGVDDSFNGTLVNSGNTFQTSSNDLQTSTQYHTLSDSGTMGVLILSLALVQLLLCGLPGVGTFCSSKCNPQFMYWLKSQGNSESQHYNIYVN
jgi:hypothetical protein